MDKKYSIILWCTRWWPACVTDLHDVRRSRIVLYTAGVLELSPWPTCVKHSGPVNYYCPWQNPQLVRTCVGVTKGLGRRFTVLMQRTPGWTIITILLWKSVNFFPPFLPDYFVSNNPKSTRYPFEFLSKKKKN